MAERGVVVFWFMTAHHDGVIHLARPGVAHQCVINRLHRPPRAGLPIHILQQLAQMLVAVAAVERHPVVPAPQSGGERVAEEHRRFCFNRRVYKSIYLTV